MGNQARRAVAGPTKRLWRSVRKALPDAIAEPLRVGTRRGLRAVGLIGRPQSAHLPEVATPPGVTSPSEPPRAPVGAENRRVSTATLDDEGAEPEMDQKPVVFFHVMKCGGTSVRVGLATAGAGRLDSPQIFMLDGDAAKAAAGGKDVDNWNFRDALLPYVVLAMRPSIVLGHFRYRDQYRELLDAAHFVTVLRDPVDRLVSLYRYLRYTEALDIPVPASFEDFIATSRWAREGHKYVDTFCGCDDLDPRSDEAVDAAVANLRRMAAVGFTDRLDDFARQLTSCLGKPVTIPMFNRSPAPEAPGDTDSEIDAGTLEHVRAVCAPDIRVYEQALATLG